VINLVVYSNIYLCSREYSSVGMNNT